MSNQNKLTGLVVCGGKSSRMGTDKSFLVYYDKPQCYHVYDMLKPFCDEVYIACNKEQVVKINKEYAFLTDADEYNNIGPMAALLIGMKRKPQNNFLAIGCDYPFITEKDIAGFLSSIKNEKIAAAFYNKKYNLYEPLLARYSAGASEIVLQLAAGKEYSLYHFLKTVDAEKYYPADERALTNVNTPGEYDKAKSFLQNSFVKK